MDGIEAAAEGGGARVAIGLGTNLGDRLAQLRHAVTGLRRVVVDVRCSEVYETTARYVEDQPDFLNACCIGRTRLTPRQLLSELKDTERRAGRRDGGARYGPRPLDLDLLLYENVVVSSDRLTIPHPRLRERAFVLIPLAAIAGDWRVPSSEGNAEATVGELAERIDREGIRRTELEL